MRAGREFDATVASRVMGLKAIEPENIPNYSTDIFAAYKLIMKLQQNGWYCNVGSRIGSEGTLFYRTRFYQQGKECERFASTVPLAICAAALAIAKDEYFEYVDILEKKQDETPIEIVPGVPSGLSSIDSDEKIIEILKNVLANEIARNQDSLSLAKNILDVLAKNNYTIIRTSPISE